MPVNVAVEEPWARVVGDKAEGDVVRCGADAHNISPDNINKEL